MARWYRVVVDTVDTSFSQLDMSQTPVMRLGYAAFGCRERFFQQRSFIVKHQLGYIPERTFIRGDRCTSEKLLLRFPD